MFPALRSVNRDTVVKDIVRVPSPQHNRAPSAPAGSEGCALLWLGRHHGYRAERVWLSKQRQEL